MFKKYAETIILIKWPLLLGLLLVTLLSGLSTCLLKIDPTVESLFVKDSPEYEYYRAYRDRYGSDQVVAVAMATSDDVFTQKNLEVLTNLTKAFIDFPHVERVISLSTVMNIEHKFMGVRAVPVLGGDHENQRILDDIRTEVLGNELFLNNLISKDGKSTNIIIRLKADFNEQPRDFVKELRDLLAMKSSRGVRFYVAGSPIEQYDFVRLIHKDQYTFVPMITLFLILMTFIIYRSFPCVVLSMSIVFVTLSWTFGLIAFLGQELNLVTSLLAPVIMIVAVVNAIHFMNLFFEIRAHHKSLKWSVILTMEQLGLPCFLTHLTTVLGFLSLVINPVPAIRNFGLFAAAGTTFSFCVSMMLVPLILPVLPYREKGEDSNEAHFFNRVLIGFLERLEHRWKWLILLLVVVSIVFSALGIKRLNVDTSLIKQMKPDSPLAIATRFIDENLTGVYSLGFILKAKGDDTILNPELLQQIDDFKTYLESMEAISKVNSITTLLKTINEARKDDKDFYQIPENRKLIRKYFEGMIEDNNPELWFLISRDLKEVRLEARMHAVGTKEGAMVEENAMRYMRENLSDEFEYNITGNVVLLGKMAKELVFFQMRSFAFAFVPILILITLIFRSVMLGILAAIPNLLPIIVVYGVMGFFGIELSTGTAMISSIVLGLVVDSSIHFLHRFRHEFKRRGHYLQALHHTYRNVGQALCVSTLILIVGFCTSIFAGFRPTVQFGLLTSLTIFIALICTLLVLPVCLVLTRPFGKQRAFK